MVPFALAGLIVAAAGPAVAHGLEPVPPSSLWSKWSFDPVVLGTLSVSYWLYGRGFSHLRRLNLRAPCARPWRAIVFSIGGLSVAVALLTPLNALSGTLLAAHMVQHVLLIAVAAPLLVLGRPEVTCFFGLSANVRRTLARDRTVRGLARLIAAGARPLPATVLHGVALWTWHAPSLFEAATARPSLHWLEHLCFFGTALLFWHALIASTRRAASAAVGALASLITVVHGGFLSALLTLSPKVLYPDAAVSAPLWGLTALEDQQLAGVIMWVLPGAAYLVAGLACAACLLSPPAVRPVPRPRIPVWEERAT